MSHPLFVCLNAEITNKNTRDICVVHVQLLKFSPISPKSMILMYCEIRDNHRKFEPLLVMTLHQKYDLLIMISLLWTYKQ